MKLEILSYNKTLKKRKILSDINYEFESGNIYGLYGHNGSGKTMILRALAGLIYPDKGKVIIDGQVLGEDISMPPSLGIVIENTKLLPEYTGLYNLKILNKIDNKLSEEQIKESMKRLALDPDDKRLVRSYSLGMNQKLALIQALMDEPELILLDEPTNGLDEEAVELVRNELIKLKKKNSTIIFASHNKEDIISLSDKIIGVKAGEIYEIDKHDF